MIISGLFTKHFERVIENDSRRSLAKHIPNIVVHCREENTIKNKMHHLKYGNDIHERFHDIFMKLFIERFKTDVYREGNWIYIIKATGNLCAVKIL